LIVALRWHSFGAGPGPSDVQLMPEEGKLQLLSLRSSGRASRSFALAVERPLQALSAAKAGCAAIRRTAKGAAIFM
jgi:hypothetical protein